MARYTGSEYRRARRVGFSTTETGKELAKKPYGPGAHGQDRKKKLSNYGEQLQEKQKVRYTHIKFKGAYRRSCKCRWNLYK